MKSFWKSINWKELLILLKTQWHHCASMAIGEDLLPKYPKGFGRPIDHVGNLGHNAEECNQIDASHEEDDDYQEHLKLCMAIKEYYPRGSDETFLIKWIPLGYKFVPNDFELVSYLKSKVDNQPLPANPIKEVTLYDSNPLRLSGIFLTPCYLLLLIFHVLVFYEGNRPSRKTNWIMHEYRLADPSQRINEDLNDMRCDDFVVCKFYKRKTKSDPKRRNDIGENNGLMTAMLQPNGVAQIGGQIPDFDSNDTTFDDNVLHKETNKSCSTILSQPLEQNTNINLCVGDVQNINAGGSVLENDPAGFRVSETLLTGLEIPETVRAGFGVPENIHVGFRAPENVGFGITTDNTLKRQKYNPNDMQFENYALWEQKDKPCYPIPSQPLEQNTNTNANINSNDAVVENVTDAKNITIEYSVC